MRRADEIHTAHPTWGYRTITGIIRRTDKIIVNCKIIRRIICDQCRVKMKLSEAEFSYLDRSFHYKIPRCPNCGQVYIL